MTPRTPKTTWEYSNHSADLGNGANTRACAYVGNKISQAVSSRKLKKKDEELESEPHVGSQPHTCMLKGKKPTQNGAAHHQTKYGEQRHDPSGEASPSPPPYL